MQSSEQGSEQKYKIPVDLHKRFFIYPMVCKFLLFKKVFTEDLFIQYLSLFSNSHTIVSLLSGTVQ